MQWCVEERFCAAELVITVLCKIRRQTPLSPNWSSGATMWETPAPLHLQTPCRQRFQRVGTQRSRNVHLVATDVALQGDLSSWRRRVVVQLVLLFLPVSRRKTSRGVEYCSRVVLKLMWHGSRIELDQLSVSLLAFAWLRSVHHIVSSGPWRRLANNKRDVVCQGMTCRGRTWALRLEETSRTVDTIQHVVARDNVLFAFSLRWRGH